MSEDKKVQIMDEVKDALPTEDVREGISEADVEVTVIDDRDKEAESLIRWGAARAGVIVVSPLRSVRGLTLGTI